MLSMSEYSIKASKETLEILTSDGILLDQVRKDAEQYWVLESDPYNLFDSPGQALGSYFDSVRVR
jgi:hypothetical protein